MSEKNNTVHDEIRFGTDGWRGIIKNDFTLRNIERITQAYSDFLNSSRKEKAKSDRRKSPSPKPLAVIVGYDNRQLSLEAAEKIISVLAGNHISGVLFDEPMPTPIISWSVRHTGAIGGIIVTASHNPPEFNGIKIKSAEGRSTPPVITDSIESLIDKNHIRFQVKPQNHPEKLNEVLESYREQICRLVDLQRIRDFDGSVVVDSMHGTGNRWIEEFIRGGKLRGKTIRAEPDANFGGVNPEPTDYNLGALRSEVRNTRSIIGLATDGDADRFGAVNEKGETMTMHHAVPLLLLHLLRNRKMEGEIVATFSQSVILKRIAEAFGLRFRETPIGFKYIAELMLENDILIGAEESGGVGIKNHIPERDGILNSLLFLESVIYSGKTPSKMVSDLQREFGAFYYARSDTALLPERGKEFIARLSAKPLDRLAGEKVTGVETLDGLKLTFKDQSWVLFRQSGTEPVLRIYCEATSTAKMRKLLIAAQKSIIQAK
jgi:phosphomannomutase